jgi:hypothetical protein
VTWTHVTIAGLAFDLIGAVVVGWAVFGVSVAALYKRALSTRSWAGDVNERAHWLGEERAYARVGVGLLVIGIALQLLGAAASGLHGASEVLFGVVAILVPIAIACAAIAVFVPRWIKDVDDAGARAGRR